MKLQFLLFAIVLFSFNLKSQTINPELFQQLHILSETEMLETTSNVAAGSLIFNSTVKAVYFFDGTKWLILKSNDRSFIDVLQSSAVEYSYTPVSTTLFYKLDACITPITYQVYQGDIISVTLQLSADYSQYNDIGEVARFYITVDGNSINGPIYSGFFSGGDNVNETGHVSLNQSFKMQSSGILNVGIEVKPLLMKNRIYNPDY